MCWRGLLAAAAGGQSRQSQQRERGSGRLRNGTCTEADHAVAVADDILPAVDEITVQRAYRAVDIVQPVMGDGFSRQRQESTPANKAMRV